MKILRNLLNKFSKKKIDTRTFSQFGGMWLDILDSSKKNAKLSEIRITNAEMADKLSYFDEHGYVILRNAIPHELCDNICEVLDNAYQYGNETINAQFPDEQGVKRAIKAGDSYKSARIIDTYMVMPEILTALFNEKIKEFLTVAFEEEPLLFQSLNFIEGSGQRLHQDTAFVVTSEPMKLIASWIALEDIQQGSGELNFVPGSHRYKEYLFSGKYKHFNPERDGQRALQYFYDHLEKEIKKKNGQVSNFLAKKGDVLLWHADLYHGGSPVELDGVTRKSLVGHYCPLSAEPNFFNFANKNIHLKDGNKFASSYYD